ncbi:hypothetical protein ASC97_28985 [Rhizobium sp. Root1203]|uniref:hypothetical protein n=1 Tax=Rhizobium sp. Root1203 TaxID=1736427 RepID=UPI00070CB1E4|nr:hypothetical protein [Rhizobium sp. Root1203]KQV19707.1 hypothetical protein ASC97_28985 [Rhizobium sp. Root1203]
MRVRFCYAILLLGTTLLPRVSVGETWTIEGPNNATISVDSACVKRNDPTVLSDTDHETRPVWIDCEFAGKRVTLMMVGLSRVLTNYNDFSADKADNLFDEITVGTDWYPLRERLSFFGGSSNSSFTPVARIHSDGWICPDTKKGCGPPERVVDLKVIGSQVATVALLTIGDFEKGEVKQADGRTIGVRWRFPEPVGKMIATFSF